MKKITIFIISTLLSVMFVSAAPTTGLKFSGAATSHLNLGQHSAFSPTQFTIEAWVDYQNLSGGYVLSTEGWGPGAHGFSLHTNGTKIEFVIGAETSWLSLQSQTDIALNTWYHVAVTYSSNEMKMYINGVLNATLNIIGSTMSNSSENICIGEGSYWKGREFSGKMAGLRFWNVVRNQEDIAAGMSSSLTGSETGLVADWEMNEGIGTAVSDASGIYNITVPADVSWFVPLTYLSSLSDGTLSLNAIDNLHMVLVGTNIRVESGGNLGYWSEASDYAYWNINIVKSGKYKVSVKYSLDNAAQYSGKRIGIQSLFSGSKITFIPKGTGGWGNYQDFDLDSIQLNPGQQQLKIYSDDGQGPTTNLKSITLSPGNSTDPTYLSAQTDGAFSLKTSDNLHMVLVGTNIRVDPVGGNLYFWSDPTEYAYWKINVINSGKYKVNVQYSLDNAVEYSGKRIAIQSQYSNTKITFMPIGTGGWNTYQNVDIDSIQLNAGQQLIKVCSDDGQGPTTNLSLITLSPVASITTKVSNLDNDLFNLKVSPNPLNDNTKISFHLTVKSLVQIKVYNAQGQFVSNIIDKVCSPEINTLSWKPNLPSGIYFIQLRSNNLNQIIRVLK